MPYLIVNDMERAVVHDRPFDKMLKSVMLNIPVRCHHLGQMLAVRLAHVFLGNHRPSVYTCLPPAAVFAIYHAA